MAGELIRSMPSTDVLPSNGVLQGNGVLQENVGENILSDLIQTSAGSTIVKKKAQ